MPSHKKTDKEKKATKKAQNRRFLDRKKVQGLKAVTVFVPVDALEKCKDMKKIGVVLGGDDLNPLVVKAVKKDGKVCLDLVDYSPSLFFMKNLLISSPF